MITFTTESILEAIGTIGFGFLWFLVGVLVVGIHNRLQITFFNNFIYLRYGFSGKDMEKRAEDVFYLFPVVLWPFVIIGWVIYLIFRLFTIKPFVIGARSLKSSFLWVINGFTSNPPSPK